MALQAPVALDTQFGEALGTLTSVTCSSISPPSDCLLVVGGGGGAGAAMTITSLSTTLSNVGAWTIIQAGAGAFGVGYIAYAKVTGAPGSGTITVNCANTTVYTLGMAVMSVLGHNFTTPVGTTDTDAAGAGTTLTATLPATPAASSMVISSLYEYKTTNAASNFTPDGSYTELQEAGQWYAAPGIYHEVQTEYDLSGADTTIVHDRPATAWVFVTAIEILEGFIRPKIVVPTVAVQRASRW